MLTELQNKLQYLENKRQKHNELINQLYSNFQIIFAKKKHLNEPFKTKNNLFLKVRAEVLCQIYAFLDPCCVLSLRLLDKQTNLLIIQTFPIIIQELQQGIKCLEIKKEKLELNEEQYQIYTELEKQRIEGNSIINNITSFELLWLKKQRILPGDSKKVALFLINLFYPNFDEKSDIWGTCQNIFRTPNFLQLLINYNIVEISEQQLEKLQLIHQYNGEKIKNWCFPLYLIFNYMELLINLRQTTIYQDKNIHYNINKIQKRINFLTKIINKNELMI